ncbi:MAG: flagellar motor switch protein FliG [Armatimonadetes bacterium]|nr:flagellar motor switch protein FliG [Armatimonadota bacterium]
MATTEFNLFSQESGAPPAPPRKTLSGLQKAAILLITLGAEASGEIMSKLKQDEVERLANELVRQEKVDMETKRLVFAEFESLYQTTSLLSQGGVEYARQVLEQALGAQKAASLIEKIVSSRGSEPSDWLQHVEPLQLARWLQNEQPQTIALVTVQLPGNRAAQVLGALDAELRQKVTRRIAKMESASPEVLAKIEQALKNRASASQGEQMRQVSGVQSLVDILNSGDRALERSILDSLASDDPALADEIKRKLFVFEDILLIDDRAVQTILREVEQEDLRLALRGSQEAVKEKIFGNMSERAASSLKEDMEMSGPVRLKDVEAAQQRIALAIRALEEKGEITIARDGAQDSEEQFV